MLTLSCQNAANTLNSDNPQSQTVQLPAIDPESVVLKADDITVSMDDYRLSIASHRMLGQNVTKRILANPRFQRDEIQRCTQTVHLRKFAQLHHVTVSLAQRQEILRQAFEKTGVQSEDKLCEKLEIACQDLDKVVEILALPRAIQRYLAFQIPEADALKAYQISHRSFKLELASFDNLPSEQEAADFIVNNKDQFSKYLGAHQELLKTPPHAEFVRMAYAKSAESPDDARRSAEALRQTAIAKGTIEALTQCKNNEQNGCLVLNDLSKLYEIERSDETSWAFKLAEGDVPELIHTHDNEEVWILQRVTAPETRNLKDPALQTTLAKKAMADTVPAPHLIEKLKPALEVQDASLSEFAKTQNAALFDDTTTFYELVKNHKDSSDSASDHLYSTKVMSILSTLNSEEIGIFSNPIVENGRLFVFIVHEMTIPNEDEFKKNQEQWREDKANDPSLGLVENLLQKSLSQMTSINIKPVQKEYGILQANGSIRY